MHSNRRMLEWGGFPGDTGTCRIAWIGWNVMNDWNVWNDWKDWNVWNVWSAFGRSVAGMPGMFLEGLVGHMDGFLEDLLAFYV